MAAAASDKLQLVAALFFLCLHMHGGGGGILALNFELPLRFTDTSRFVLERANDTPIAPVPDTSLAFSSINLTASPNSTILEKQKYNVGRLKYKESLTFPYGAVPSFNTSFTFLIETVTDYNKSGDGIAFALTNDARPPVNSTGRFLGLTPENPNDQQDHTFFALEFDTFRNRPQVDPGFDDPSSSHIGINVNSLNSVYVRDTSDRNSPLYLYNNYFFKAWLEYNASEPSVRVWATNVTLADVEFLQRPADPIFDHKDFNLSQKLRVDHLYAVITAASGNNSEGHSVFEWKFQSESLPASATPASRSKLPMILGIIAALLIVVIAIGTAFGARILYRRRRRHVPNLLPLPAPTGRPALASSRSIRTYSYDDFRKACGDFSGGNIIGEGGCGVVYRGVLGDGEEVAVKKMKKVVLRKDFYREVDILRRLDHPNLLPLLGWCSSNINVVVSGSSIAPAPADLSRDGGSAEGMLLVYPFIRNGSLERYIGSGDMALRQKLGRERRLEILCQVSEALAYLHRQNCVHRDVKPSNMLLTEAFDAKVGDFGLARVGKPDTTRVTVTEMAAGTPGYMAPELVLAMDCRHPEELELEMAAAEQPGVSYKADVYSFGVLALKMATGVSYSYLDVPRLGSALQRSMDSGDHGDFVELLDAVVRQEEDGKMAAVELQQWRCIMLLGLRCISRWPADRPPMARVSQALRAVRLAQFPDILDSLLLQL